VTVQEAVETVIDDGVASLTLSRPDRLNAVDAAMRGRIVDLLAAFADDEAVKAVLLTGAGDAFSSGQDLDELAGLDSGAAAAWIRALGAFYQAIRLFPKPTVAAVNGIAAGAGMQLALHADIRIGSSLARFAQTEINVGLPSVLGPWVMQRVIGFGATLDMSLTGRIVEAEEALRIGLLSRIVPSDALPGEALALAQALGARPAVAIQETKAWMAEIDGKTFPEAIEAAAASMETAFASGEPGARIAAFMERRKTPRR